MRTKKARTRWLGRIVFCFFAALVVLGLVGGSLGIWNKDGKPVASLSAWPGGSGHNPTQ